MWTRRRTSIASGEKRRTRALGGPDVLGRFAVLAGSIEEQPGARLPGSRRMAARETARVEGLVVSDGLLAEIEAA